MTTATIIGSGPNGLAAAIVLASHGIKTTVCERNPRIGGACSTAEITRPGFRHDLGSSVYPFGVASPFFRSLPLTIPWIEPPAACAHPLDDGTAVMLEHSLSDTVANIDPVDGRKYRSLLEPLVDDFPALLNEVLQPLLHMPRRPFLLGRFGLSAFLPAVILARSRFRGKRAQALFAGMAAHSVLSLDATASSAAALLLMAAGHASGWPVVEGGAQILSDLLVQHLEKYGGTVVPSAVVTKLPESELVLADTTPRQLMEVAGREMPDWYRRQLARYRYGAGTFKIDYALSDPIPWRAKGCMRAATVHLGGTLDEIVVSERTFDSESPFVLLVQPSLFDPSRAPSGKHTAWAYCHVPAGSEVDRLSAIEKQIERFAPGFRECVLERKVSTPALLERWNPNLIGGELAGGVMDLRQIIRRPTFSEYRTPMPGLFLCGASTPPGAGVHGMCGFHAASAALRSLKSGLLTGEQATRRYLNLC